MASTSSKPTALPVSLGLFGVGLLAIVVIFGLYATGCENLPTWLNLTALLAPLGLVTGLISVVVTARRR